MAATYTYAVRYEVDALCRTPLRTGGTDGDPQVILKDGDGTALYQGSSLAGALRGWLAVDNEHMAERLFGSQKMAGHLIVSDGVFQRDATSHMRPRLRINGRTGSAADGGKFDAAHLDAGSHFHFSLTWLGLQNSAEEICTVEQLLSALHSGEIRLGAQKSNGFGRVELKVLKSTFDLTNPADRTAWLQESGQGKLLSLAEVTGARRVTFVVSGQADSLLVKAGAPLQKQDKGTYTPNLTEGGRPVLPGSSVKGAVRARAEMIANLLGIPKEMTEDLFGREAGQADNGKPGCAFFEDGYLTAEKRQQISRIRINRFTGGVIRNGLFTEEPLSCDIELRVTAPDDPVACGLLLYALRDLGLGLYNLGSGAAIGRGYLAVSKICAVLPDGKQAKLLFDRERKCTADDTDGVFKTWLDALGGEQA